MCLQVILWGGGLCVGCAELLATGGRAVLTTCTSDSWGIDTAGTTLGSEPSWLGLATMGDANRPSGKCITRRGASPNGDDGDASEMMMHMMVGRMENERDKGYPILIVEQNVKAPLC